MKKGRIGLGVASIYLCVSLSSVFGQTASEPEEQGPDRILRMLNEKEQSFINGTGKPDELSAEEIEHTIRVQRLHQLETAKDVELEPAGAQLVANQSDLRQEQESEIEDLELQQQESTTVMMRDMARLRAEVMRLNARVQALEMELDGTGDSAEFEAEPKFYLPVR